MTRFAPQPEFDFSSHPDITGMIRRYDRAGSTEAAKVIALTSRQTDKAAVLKLLEAAGERGLTDYDIAHLMSTPGNPRKQTSLGKRRGELVADGLVVPRLVVDPRTLKLVQELRVPIAGSQSRCGVWCCVGYQKSAAGGSL